jgi:hypothetical protein
MSTSPPLSAPRHLRVLVISTCTGMKAITSPAQLLQADFAQGQAHLADREQTLTSMAMPAAELYTGQQHLRLMRGISAAESAGALSVDLRILSAGYGLIPGDRNIVPYEVTFAGMSGTAIGQWAKYLNIPQAFKALMFRSYDLALVLLGDNYLRACAIDAHMLFNSPTVLVCGTASARKLSPRRNLLIATIDNADAARFNCGMVGLKGEVCSRLLTAIAGERLDVREVFECAGRELIVRLASQHPIKPVGRA